MSDKLSNLPATRELILNIKNELENYCNYWINFDPEVEEFDGLDLLADPLEVVPLYKLNERNPAMLKILLSYGGPTITLHLEENGFFRIAHSLEGVAYGTLTGDALDGLGYYMDNYACTCPAYHPTY